MLPKVPGGLSPAEFDKLIEAYIEREDPHAISLDVLAELDESLPTEPFGLEFLGRVVNGELELMPLPQVKVAQVRGNEIVFANGWRVIVEVKPPDPVKL